MDLRDSGRNRIILLMVLIGIGSFSRQILELQIGIKELFVMRMSAISFLLFSVMYYSPGLFSSDGIWSQRMGRFFHWSSIRTWAFLFIGLAIAGGALFQEVEGGQGLQDIILLCVLFSASSFWIAFSLVVLTRNLIGGSTDDHLETNNFDWGLDLIGEAFEAEQRYLGGRGLVLAKRVRKTILEEISNNGEIGDLISRRESAHLWGVDYEVSTFCRKKSDKIQRMLYEKDEISIVSNKRLPGGGILSQHSIEKYVNGNLRSEFEERLLHNLSMRAIGANDVFARNLIGMFPGVDEKIREQNYEMKIIKRQMILFLHLFSDIFQIKVSKDRMGVGVARMHLGAIFEYLYENDPRPRERSPPAQWKYEDIRIAGQGPDSITSDSEVASASRNLASRLDPLSLGLKRLDMKVKDPNEKDEVNAPLRDFSEACWSYFRQSEV